MFRLKPFVAYPRAGMSFALKYLCKSMRYSRGGKGFGPGGDLLKPENASVWNDLNEDQARDLIAGKHFAHLGCVLEDGTPYVLPINYLLKNDSIYIHSLLGTKVKALRRNSRACVQVEDIRSPYRWRSAIAYGEFEEIRDKEERAGVIGDLLAEFDTLTPVEGLEAENSGREDVVVFRIRIRRLTGVAEN